MKKLFLAVLAVAALAACKKDALVQQQEGTAITFSNAFVDNATRAVVSDNDPTITTTNIESMRVWGFVSRSSGFIFKNTLVTKKNGVWTYSPPQYWFPGHDYYFAAVAPVNDNIEVESASGDSAYYGLGTITFTNDGNTDLLYSATTVSTRGKSVADTYDPVAFTFNHLLSKVRITFANRFEQNQSNIHTLELSDITLSNVPAKASINVAQADWWTTNEWVLAGNPTTSFTFNKIENITNGRAKPSDSVHFLIPTNNVNYKISFKVTYRIGGVAVIDHVEHVTEITGVNFEIGKAYNLKAEIGPENISPDGSLKPIEFSAEVKDWDYGNNYGAGIGVPLPGYDLPLE